MNGCKNIADNKKSTQIRGVLKTISRRKILTGTLTGLIALGISAGLTAIRPPVPGIHDEFSYLLAADTFCQGRCTNPTHPFWQHFETFQVIQQPSYASKYPPGQGIMLAVGQWLTGQPIVGIWILSALAAVACYWMLLGWVSRRWAALGGFLFAVHPTYQIIWGQSFWGGTLAFLGGALVFGAAARMRHRPQVLDAIAMSLGAVILAVSRPYEGLVFCLIVDTVVLAYWWRHGLPARPMLLRAIVPQLVLLLIGGTCLAHYNRAVTGNWRTMPYQVHESTYALSPSFLWKQPHEDREYRHTVFSKFHHDWEMESYDQQQSISGYLETKVRLFRFTWNHFFPLPMLLPLLFVPFCRARNKGTVFVVAGLAWLPSAVTVWNFPHYLAPMAPVLMVLVLLGLRQINVFGKKHLNQPRLATLCVAFQIAFFFIAVFDYAKAPQDNWQWHRATLLQQLEDSPGRHLVFVHYDTNHNTHHEWVYNRANIDLAPVVWAREMGSHQDQLLREYFSDHQIWFLAADAEYPTLIPYDEGKRRLLNSPNAVRQTRRNLPVY